MPARKTLPQPRVTIGFVDIEGDPRHEPIRAYERMILKTREHPFAGAQVGIDEAQALTRALKIDFALERITVKSADALAPAVMQAREARGIHFFIVDAPAEAFQPLAEAVKGRDVLLFNATAPEDWLRRELCAREVVHTLPSLAMTMDGLAQHLVSRKWRDILVLQGPAPADADMTRAFEASVKKFGARIVGKRDFKPGTDPREREKNNPLLLTALNRDYDVIFIADDAFDFARQLPYQTVARAAGGRRDRPRAGRLALDLGAQRRTAAQFALPARVQGPPHGKPGLGGLDRREDGGAGDAAHAFRRLRHSSARSSSAATASTATRGSRSACGPGTSSSGRPCSWRRRMR